MTKEDTLEKIGWKYMECKGFKYEYKSFKTNKERDKYFIEMSKEGWKCIHISDVDRFEIEYNLLNKEFSKILEDLKYKQYSYKDELNKYNELVKNLEKVQILKQKGNETI